MHDDADAAGPAQHLPLPRRAAVKSAPSVRRQLFKPLIWSWLFGMSAALAGAYWVARSSVNIAFDRGLQDEATTLAARVQWSDRGPLLDLSRQAMESPSWDLSDRNGFAMVDIDGNVLAGDAHVPPTPEALRRGAYDHPQLFDGHYGELAVRGAVFSVHSPMLDRSVAIVVIESRGKRTALLRDIQLSIVLPALALGALTFLLLNWGIRRGLQPLREVAADVAGRASHDWRPLELGGVPREALPLIERINSLLSDMRQSVALQRRFVADAAHQLRTPVAGIRVLAQSLEQELRQVSPAGAAPWQPVLRQLLTSTDRLARLIGQLLSLARSETALAVNAEQRECDVTAIVREACEPLLVRALAAGRSLALDAPPAPVLARAHPLWLGEVVVVNLVDNALRYGGAQIEIVVRACPAGGAEVWVCDDGQGVPATELERLFEPFWRGERADQREEDGTGLGLAIAREIVERLGGRLIARSRPEVAGMRFEIRLAA